MSKPVCVRVRTRITLGTSGGLNLNGKMIDDAARVMLAWAKIDNRQCRACHHWLKSCIASPDTGPVEERASNPDDPLLLCDECWEKAKVPA